MRYWLTVGSPANWRSAFSHANIWGLKPGRFLEAFWEVVGEGDRLLFYVGRPVAGVVGFGTVKTKFKQPDVPLWDDEIRAGRVLYPLRFEFDPDFCLPPDKWETGRVCPDALKSLVRAGFQPLNPAIALAIVQELAPDWTPKEMTQGVEVGVQEQETTAISHEEVKSMLVEIGRIQRFLAEPEYAVDTGRLDVVWRRIEKSVPTYVFEVQVAGDIYHALAKLKHAYDLWNSHIFLVGEYRDRAKFDQLLAGSFHEIRDQIRFLPIAKVCDLLKRKRAFKELEAELQIPT